MGASKERFTVELITEIKKRYSSENLNKRKLARLYKISVSKLEEILLA